MSPLQKGCVAVALVLAACNTAAEPASSAPARAAAEPAANKDGLCAEHGVLEAVCTKCNPALAAVFKAKGDWCPEHGFPESFCPICHPERGGRPSVDVEASGAPADGTKVRFKTKDTARLAGIQVEKVAERASQAEVVATALIVYDAAKVAEVNARSPGVIRAMRADIGASVRAGAPLCTIESAGVGAEQSRLVAARSRLRLAEANHERLSSLHQQGIAAKKDALLAAQELEAARAELSGAQAALGVIGNVAEGASRYTLTAPIAGIVTQRNATLGRLVDTDKVLFEIVDTSSMWAEIDIPESAVTRVAVGTAVSVSVDGIDGKEFTGSLSYIAPAIEPHTRTVKGRVALANPEGLLRGNMFARARIRTSGPTRAVVVPRGAVQRAKDAQLVFVRTAEDVFEARRVTLGSGDERLVEVSGRLGPGDEVATDGSFLLKTETLKGSIGAGCCDVEGPK
ncbi:MAG TPA: efflux RND transporter periplasmic adaptor subunit [Polyangiaceae bacterium]|nr:efflux RND transporter periplasmic adaptor subunit [Polyangiaceae bacterium]